MIVLGLTGSIGMGKSTVAAMMKVLGIPVHDSDAAVHRLLGPRSEAQAALQAAFPPRDYPDVYDKRTKAINRKELGRIVFADEALRLKLEGILHPLVQKSQGEFLRQCRAQGAEIAVLEIPLLYETGAERRVDAVIVVSAPAFLQKARVMGRPGMDEAKFNAILARQIPDSEKRARADHVIHTGLGRAQSMKELREILDALRGGRQDEQVEKARENDHNPMTMRIQR